jgi:putative DNA primase/helicase
MTVGCAMTAEAIAKALGGRKVGAAWMARCPAHDDRAPSLSIADARDSEVLVRCHGGCDQRDVIAALRARGIWDADERWPIRFSRKPDREAAPETDRDAIRRTESALAIWRNSQPAEGTPVETYLRSRGLTITMSSSIRFHAGLKHPSGTIWPAMVALVTHGADAKPIGIHRTFLARDGSAKAPVEPAKMMLGPSRGGAVRLAQHRDVLMVGEGIETCLAAQQVTGQSAWAALSTSGLRSLNLPKDVRNVIVLADGDDPGEAAAQDCGWRWKRENRRVRIARPPQAMDFNDLLMPRAPRVEGAAR